ncbi:hypothetical protein PK52_gp29 [Geobacillus phage vB_GthS_PK5.2]|nr:hypothetical protein PK52_gp29 [Geobacillus phage vB_GthS_PK5.2]
MEKPSHEAIKRVYTFFLRTSIPRILAEREGTKANEKEVNSHAKTPQRV